MMKVAYKQREYLVESTEGAILKTLAYFSVFDYPLTKDEINKYLHPLAKPGSDEQSLQRLINSGSIFKINEFYSLVNDASLVTKRVEANARAAVLLPKAEKIGRCLSRFPYVRGVGISGSLSKMDAQTRADFDFFIITKANRLWIARTIMHLFKKLTFITGRQHQYCMNYYLDENALRLRDQNIYTAIETITLIPVSGGAMQEFFNANSWVSEWFTNYENNIVEKQRDRGSWFKSLVERIFNNKTGDRLEQKLLTVTTDRWKKKQAQRKLNYEGKEMALVTGKHYAWSNPDSFQEKIIALYHKKVNALKAKWPEYFGQVNFSFEE